ncbi:MAG TPA: hypothetical protein VMY42_18480 [Thermoguttaceae bacterium]|nr:hypothetical protein [Thermoguttaceae bacterium]
MDEILNREQQFVANLRGKEVLDLEENVRALIDGKQVLTPEGDVLGSFASGCFRDPEGKVVGFLVGALGAIAPSFTPSTSPVPGAFTGVTVAPSSGWSALTWEDFIAGRSS